MADRAPPPTASAFAPGAFRTRPAQFERAEAEPQKRHQRRRPAREPEPAGDGVGDARRRDQLAPEQGTREDQQLVAHPW